MYVSMGIYLDQKLNFYYHVNPEIPESMQETDATTKL